MMIDYMIKENGDLKAAFELRFDEETERCTEFIKDLIDGNTVILIYVLMCNYIYIMHFLKT